MKVQSEDVSELGSVEENECLRNLTELKIEEESAERVNWLRNDIKVIIMSKNLKGESWFLKKGVVVELWSQGCAT